jgi:DNA-binding transcriptional LysR family regulator
MPVPEISLYWHKRHDADAAHRWLRQQIAAACAPLIRSCDGRRNERARS